MRVGPVGAGVNGIGMVDEMTADAGGKQIVVTEAAPPAAGPYSQATVGAGLVFVSGQLPIDPATGALVEGPAAQARQSLRNVEAILAARGVPMSAILKCTVFLTDMATFTEVNDVYASFFPDAPPARSAFGVSALPRGAQVEIEAIALDARTETTS